MRFRWGLVNNLVNKIVLKVLYFKAFKSGEYHHIHLTAHKLVREVGVHFSDKALGTIAHPYIDNIRAFEVLLANRRKGVSQAIGGSLAVAEQRLEQLIALPV